jgi:predicted alpha/beta-fold hydrolase
VDVGALPLAAAAAANPRLVAAVTRRGGHVAWHETLGRAGPLAGPQWADAACAEFLCAALACARDAAPQPPPP